MSRDPGEYSILEFVLHGLFIGGAICFFIVAGERLYQHSMLDAAEAAGLGLLLLGGANDPTRYILDSATFPLRITDSAGRETGITRTASGLGLALWLTGLVGNWLG